MAAASPFSFHCMICFEEFQAEKRFPVVLPCGHTYVCNICADRLDKCMECRTPLVETAMAAKPLARSTPSSSSTGRWSRSSGGRVASPPNVPKQQAPIKKRVALPKNVVLLSLMDATELATQRVPLPSSPYEEAALKFDWTNSFEDLEKQDSDVEEKKIQMGTSLAVSGCGTYSVREKEGLLIFPSRPTTASSTDDGDQQTSGIFAADENENTLPSEEDVDTLVRFFHLDHTALGGTGEAVAPGKLSYGDRIQIVSIDEGWAKLARGYGFVRSDRNQLVKVGGSIDRACRLEAMLHSLSIRRRELRNEQSHVDSKFVVLMNELQSSLMNDEDLTVIEGTTFAPSEVASNFESVDVEQRDNKSATYDDEDNASSGAIDITKPIAFLRQTTPDVTGMGCFSSEMLDALPVLGLTVSQSPPNHRAISAGARAWRERHGRQESKGIDFRTGLSGHMALLSTHAHPHEYLDRENTGASMRMSSHSGLTVSKSKKAMSKAKKALRRSTSLRSASSDSNSF